MVQEPGAMPGQASRGTLRRALGFFWEHLTRFVIVAGLILLAIGLVAERVKPTTILRQVVEEYDQARDRDDLIERHLESGDALLAVDELDAARREFEAAIELEPTNPDGRRGLFKIELFQSIKDDPAASAAISLSRLQSLVDDDPKDPAIHAYLGDAYLVGGDHEAAREEYDAALAQNAGFARAYLGKGLLLDLVGKRVEAMAMYERAATLAPTNQAFLNNMAYQTYLGGEYSEAIARYESLLGIDKRYMLSHYVVASAYRLLGDLESARYYLSSVVSLFEDPEARALARNSVSWFFHLTDASGESGVQWLLDYEAKEYYARMSLALTMWLQGAREQALQEVGRARKLTVLPRDREGLEGLVGFDIRTLSAAQPQFARMAGGFSKDVLVTARGPATP